jgi:hypothetical protein
MFTPSQGRRSPQETRPSRPGNGTVARVRCPVGRQRQCSVQWVPDGAPAEVSRTHHVRSPRGIVVRNSVVTTFAAATHWPPQVGRSCVSMPPGRGRVPRRAPRRPTRRRGAARGTARFRSERTSPPRSGACCRFRRRVAARTSPSPVRTSPSAATRGAGSWPEPLRCRPGVGPGSNRAERDGCCPLRSGG